MGRCRGAGLRGGAPLTRVGKLVQHFMAALLCAVSWLVPCSLEALLVRVCAGGTGTRYWLHVRRREAVWHRPSASRRGQVLSEGSAADAAKGWEPNGKPAERLDSVLRQAESSMLSELADLRVDIKRTWKASGVWNAAWSEAELRRLDQVPSLANGGPLVPRALK